jgi:protein-tyrosine phosphatase
MRMAGSGSRPVVSDDDVASLVRAIAAEPGRHIPVPGTLNFRDAGGYPVAGGGTIRWRQLLRSDAVQATRLDPAAADLLGRLGLRTILDLRTSYETGLAPSPLDDLDGALTMHISLIGADMTGLPAGLAEIYDYIVDRQGPAIGAAIRSLARPNGLPALVHCTAGKDRTGMVVAFTLAAMGVPDHIIAADYGLTGLYLDPRHTPTIGRVRQGSGLGEALTEALLASPPELIVATLDRAREQAGSVLAYLARNGVTEADLSALRAALVTGEGG